MANTLSSKNVFAPNTIILSAKVNANFDNLIAAAPVWQKVTFAYTDINTASGSFTATAFTLDPLEYVSSYVIKHSTAFTGGSVTGIDLALGITSNNTKHVSSFDIFQGVTTTAFLSQGVNDMESFASTVTVFAKFTSTGSNLDSLTAGSVDIWLQKNLLP